jgi:hypothetical protein
VNRLVFSIAVLVAMLVMGGGFYFLTRTAAPDGAVSESGGPEADSEGVPPPRGDDATPAEPAPEAAPRNPRALVPPRIPEPAAPPPDPTTGTLRIDSDVPGAQVFIDRTFIGTVPLTVRDLTPGTHRLNVDAPGYDGVLQTIEVEPGESELFVPLREVPLDASIPVVHEHRLGSCRGQLVATAGGIRYQASDRNDSFEAALPAVERFEMDYQERKLRLRVGGRQYDFTDPDGNADRLFVFHRDVEKARAMLKSMN